MSDVIIIGEPLRAGCSPGELRAHRIAQPCRDIDEVVAELAVAVGIAIVDNAVRMSGRAFVDGADGGVPTFPERVGVSHDGQESVA